MINLFLLNSLVVVTVVFIHYEFLVQLNTLMPKLKIRHRFRIILGVCGALVAHAIEVWVFASAYYFMNHWTNWGTFEGKFNGSFMDCVYFSFSTFTTLGFGDIIPLGEIRFLTGIESLTGLVLITWTASFLFIEMTRCWEEETKI